MTVGGALFSYEGRLGRGSWWLWTTLLLAAYGLVLAGAQAALPNHWPYITTIAAIVCFRCHTALGAKRLHDQGARGWPILPFWFVAALIMARPDGLARWRDSLAGECCEGPVQYWTRWAMVAVLAAYGLWLLWRLGFRPPRDTRLNASRRIG